MGATRVSGARMDPRVHHYLARAARQRQGERGCVHPHVSKHKQEQEYFELWAKQDWGDKIKEDEMGGICSKYWWNEKCIQKFSQKHLIQEIALDNYVDGAWNNWIT